MKISIIEIQGALNLLYKEVQTSEGAEAYELLSKYVEQQREKQINEGTLKIAVKE
jgi:hypothetical protein